MRDKVQNRQDEADPTPARLRDDAHAQAFWGLAKRNLKRLVLSMLNWPQTLRNGWQHDATTYSV
ncbi:hypothetical protein [Phyllobacterium chamaecytisi]|uniref:hypothetical protein n=1 Tax=Phyllobacterium chamaecytisi TaxID=2876082 RepID=UPI001CCF7DEE|nr:hypothetical protein [Phyllobacterium sp. KW56]MBZ9606027.1 hypothetical protein [Phyllobacterium sp. KW56]